MRTTARSTNTSTTRFRQQVPAETAFDSPSLTITAPRRLAPLESISDILVLGVSGDVDMMTAPRLHQALREQLRHADRALVDLSDVDFLGADGIAVLVEVGRRVPLAVVARQRSQQRSSQQRASQQGPALRALTAAGADEELAVYSTLVDAENALNGHSLPAIS